MTYQDEDQSPINNADTMYRSGWRPAMAWTYIIINIFDFILFPMLFAMIFVDTTKGYHEWHPLTLQGGGMFHVAMGAILTGAVVQRSREKLASMGVNSTPFGGIAPAQPPAQSTTTRAD